MVDKEFISTSVASSEVNETTPSTAQEVQEATPQTFSLPTGKNHTSFSEVKDWMECSWRHHLKYVKKIDKQQPSIHLVFGRAAHSVLENWVNTRVFDFTEASILLKEDIETNASHPNYEKITFEDEFQKLQKVTQDVPAYFDLMFPDWQLVRAEEPMYEPIPNNADVNFKGFIDLIIETTGKKGEKLFWILDYKSALRPWNQDKMRNTILHQQLILYKTFWATKHNVSMSSIRCAFLVLNKSSKPGKSCQLVPISVGDTTSGRALKVLNNFSASVKRGIALKNRDSCKYCDYKETEYCT